MKLRSIVWIPLAMLLTGCGGKKQEPVGIGQTATFTADGVSENLFSGKKTKVQMDADLTVDAVMQVRNASVDDQACLLLVLARIKNNSKEPLTRTPRAEAASTSFPTPGSRPRTESRTTQTQRFRQGLLLHHGQRTKGGTGGTSQGMEVLRSDNPRLPGHASAGRRFLADFLETVCCQSCS